MEVQLAEAKEDYKHWRGRLRDLENTLKNLYDNDQEKAPVDFRDQYIEAQDSYLDAKNCYTTVRRFIDTTVSEITIFVTLAKPFSSAVFFSSILHCNLEERFVDIIMILGHPIFFHNQLEAIRQIL
jgi:hypothetical protein